MAMHRLKTWPEFFWAAQTGMKTFECRLNDRNFQKGDTVVLHEWNPATQEYTGGELWFCVGYVLCGEFGIGANYCVFSLLPYYRLKK